MTAQEPENPLKAFLTATAAGKAPIVKGFTRFMAGARNLQPRVPKNSQEVYNQAMAGLTEEADRLTEISDSATFNANLEHRASIAQRRAAVLKTMIDVEKTKVDLLKANLDVDTVVFAVFSAMTDALNEAFDEVPNADPMERQRWKIAILNLLKDKSSSFRDKVDTKILEVRDTLPKMEQKTGGNA